MAEVAEVRRDKPFPWRCWKCREKAVNREAIPYESGGWHEGVWRPFTMAALVAPRCGNCGEILIDDAADEQIERAFQAHVQSLPVAGD